MAVNAAGAVLRLAYLEDNADDRWLIIDRLRRDGFSLEVTSADNRSKFEAALRTHEFDVILSDFTLPSYNGVAALAEAQAIQPDVPFIFVSGTIGEERAVESLRMGATDYVLKHHLDRLAPAVQRALRDARARMEHRKAIEALRRSEERFQQMAANIRDMFWMAGPDGVRVSYVSPAFDHIWGRPVGELYAEREGWLSTIPAEDLARVQLAKTQLREGLEYRIEYRVLRADGKFRWVEDRGYPILGEDGATERTAGVVSDITNRKELEAQLQQAQKLEAMGQLAGGVAHDFNNLLTVINGHAELLLDDGGMAPEVTESVRQVFNTGAKAASLTRQLLVFSHKHPVQREPIVLNEVINGVAQMLQCVLGDAHQLALKLSADIAAVEADRTMLEQILVNLAVNARDAMAHGGRLEIATDMRVFTAEESAQNSSRRAGRFVRLAMSDTGAGISPEILPRIFEPFFTTKPVGQGTGLGLATVFGIVKRHDGWIEVESTAGVGTTFHLFLPEAAEGRVRAAAGAPPTRPLGGTETILLVEDEPAVRDYAAALLKRYGYRVLQASGGDEALETWKWHQSRIALLLTDLVMPGELTGVTLAETLRIDAPTLPVIFTSGYATDDPASNGRLAAGSAFIHKPYTGRALAKLVREVLDAKLATEFSIDAGSPVERRVCDKPAAA